VKGSDHDVSECTSRPFSYTKCNSEVCKAMKYNTIGSGRSITGGKGPGLEPDDSLQSSA
jgi:hypothetical protein